MSRRVLVVADDQVKPTATRYVRYFIDGDRHPDHLTPTESIVFEPAAAYRCFRLDPPTPESLRALELKRYTSIYFWPLYDRILLQSTFRNKDAVGKAIVDALPLSAAHHLLYSRGQFAATHRRTVQPLILEPGLLQAVVGEREPEILRPGKQGTLREDRVRLRQSLDAANFWGDLFPADLESPGKARLRLPLPADRAFPELSQAVSATIKKGGLRLLMIDDDLEWLRLPFEALGGTKFPDAAADSKGGDKSDALWVLEARAGEEQPTIQCLDYDSLRQTVAKFSDNRGTCLSVVVTDVLFGGGSEHNGLEVVRHLRSLDGRQTPRNVVIAFTGYGSPLLTAACHGEGADFVVQKAGAAGHGETRSQRLAYPSFEPLVEMFWNVLWLRAATWFTCERLAQLEYELRVNPSTMKAAAAERLVDRVSRDIEAVFPPLKWLTCLRRWRQQVVEVLTESANYVHFWSSARGQESKELRLWRTQILDQLNSLSKKVLTGEKPSADAR